MTSEEQKRKEYMDNLWDGVPDPDDECYQINFPISEKRNFDPTPMNLKRHFLHRAAPLIDDYIDAALGERVFRSTNDHARMEVWNILKEIISKAHDPAPMVDIKGQPIEDQVDKILTMMSTGKCSLADAKEFMSLVSQGFELTELPEIMKKMEALENLGVL